MWRIAAVMLVLVFCGILVQADSGPQQVVNSALIQVQDCLELNQSVRAGHSPVNDTLDSGLTFGALFATLGIGLLSILFFVPAALVAECIIRRGDDNYTNAAG